jgi:hypothetical protein
MNYNMIVQAKRNENRGMMHENRVVKTEMRVEVAALHPGGSPRVTEGCAMVEVVVWINPEASVRTKVAKVGNPASVGNAVTFWWPDARTALYVLVARPEEKIPSAGVLTDVLNVYDGVVYVGVERMKFGSVVATVADSEDKNAETASGVSMVAFGTERAYKPIIGVSFALIP